jgi:hypothetical protein
MTENEALELINDKNATVSVKGLKKIVDTCLNAAAERGDSLEQKVLGEYSFYEGQVNAFNIVKTLLDKLEN